MAAEASLLAPIDTENGERTFFRVREVPVWNSRLQGDKVMKYKIEHVKTEERGFIPKYRETVKDSEGQVRVGEFKPTHAEAEQSARERLSGSKKNK